jgi:alkylation response protein AidB-like acyl-CoA dehydrogenase
MGYDSVLTAVARIAERFAADRKQRQKRRELDPAEFAALAETGYLLTGVPVEHGGLFVDVRTSSRPTAEILRTLARGDSSVALVSSMHPAVLGFWLATPTADEPYTQAWAAQRAELAALASDGAWFGTITSEPGSGGDVSQTRATARLGDGGLWHVTGQKHFGSGSGVTSFMLTAARPEGEEAPDWFLFDMRGVPWDGSRGVKLIAPWDGHGMIATQSHGMMFEDFGGTRRSAWPGNWQALSSAAAPFVGSLFTAVILGVVEAAMAEARAHLEKKKDSLDPYEQVEWSNAEMDAWLMRQAYEGLLRAVETEPVPLRSVLLGKTTAAKLAEDCTRRLSRIIGGATFGRGSPFGFWFEDVRALGFLRPPWPLAYDALIASAFVDGGSYFGR